jgi:hypothetical protein
VRAARRRDDGADSASGGNLVTGVRRRRVQHAELETVPHLRPAQEDGSPRRRYSASMAPPAADDTNDLARLVATLRSAWLLVLAITVAGALGALALSYVQSPRYDSEATILYAPSGLDADADSARADREVTTAVDLIEAEAVLAPVARRLGETTADLREQVEVARREGADTITIRATGGSAEEAQQRAGLVSAGFRAYSRSLQQRQIDGRIASYERQIGALGHRPRRPTRRPSGRSAPSSTWSRRSGDSPTATSWRAMRPSCLRAPTLRSPSATPCWAPSQA